MNKKTTEIPSGTLENLNDSQTKTYNQFVIDMQQELIAFPSVRTKWSLLRFLRARKFDMKKTKEMLRNYLKFRVAYPHYEIMTRPMTDFKIIHEFYACGFCHFDFDGNLIVVEEVAKSKPDKIFEAIDEDTLMAFLIQKYERMIYVVMPFLSKLHKKRIDQTCLIIDLKKVKTGMFFNKKLRDFLNICARMGQDYYPEILARCFIINAPLLFKGVWSVLSTMLDERTVSKIFIESDNGFSVMKKYLNVDVLPVSLGGKNDKKLDELNGPWERELVSSYQRQSFKLEDRTPEYTYYYTEAERNQINEQARIHDQQNGFLAMDDLIEEIGPINTLLTKEFSKGHIQKMELI